MTEDNVVEELRNIWSHYPVFPGDTLSHATANECVKRGWAKRDESGNFIPVWRFQADPGE